VTVPRLLSPFTRTRTRLICTSGLLLAVLIAALLPWWQSRADGPRAQRGVSTPSTARDEAAAMAEARRTGKETLVETATTATSLTWALPSGQLRTSIHAVAQRTKDGAGKWKPIDTKLIRTPGTPGGLDIRPVNAPVPVRFSGGSRQTGDGSIETVLAEVDIDGHTIAYTWPGPLPNPVLDGPRALYPEVRSGMDLLIVALEEGGFSQLLIVKNRAPATVQAASALTYGLRSKTAVFHRDKTTGGVQVLDPGNGQEISSIPSPFAWDSAGKASPDAAHRTAVATTADVLSLSGLSGAEPGARHAQIPTRLDGDGTGNARLHLAAATTGLFTDEAVRFPVFVDPTLKGATQAWATVYKKNPNTNTWNGTNFNNGTTDARVGYESDTGHTTRSFWRMAYSTGLAGATISAATFKVLNNHSWSCTAREMQLWLTNAISSGTTWNAQPSWLALQQKQSFAHGYSSSCADDYVSFDVRDAAKKGADGRWPNITFGMRATSESDTLTWRKFRATSAELSVTYNRSPAEPTNGTSSPGGPCVPGPTAAVTVAKTNIVLSATGSDPDGNLSGLRFRFWKNGTTAPAGTLVTSLTSGKGTLTISSTTLEDQATYLWDVRAEDSAGAVSTYFPPGTEPCRLTIDASAPPAPDVTSSVFKEATPDGATWATVKFGETGPVTFTAADANKFSYSIEGIDIKEVTASSGTATVPDLKPRHAGPTTLEVYAYDAVGNRSARTDYTFYVPPRDKADGPGDTGGDGIPDLLTINSSGNLRTYPGDVNGELYTSLAASYTTGNTLNPTGHWYDPATGKAALITKHSDAYPGDGLTDLFARAPDGGFWLYPGDGYGSFNVDKRIRILLPPNTPDPATWTQIKAVGDITGDKLPDLVLRSGAAWWTLTGYTGASFQQAVLMLDGYWANREIINVADVDLDGTPDLLWRDLDVGYICVRHGKPGAVAGSVDLGSINLASNSREGDVPYGSGWTGASITAVVGIPDVNGDGVPDIWARSATDGKVRIYHPSTTNVGPEVKVITADWSTRRAFG
jgi:hypothetical protein